MSLLDIAVSGLSSRISRACFQPLMRGRASVFMLHRLADESLGVPGHSAEYVRQALAALRRSGAQFVSLRTLVDAYRGRGPGANWVAFTIDDGFHDQATLARVFAEANCPVTVFLISGFLDRQIWPWDDQITYVLTLSTRQTIKTQVGDTSILLDLSSPRQRCASIDRLRAQLKSTSNSAIYEFVAGLASQAEVALPAIAPAAYRPMSWDDARALESVGVEFGPHSVTHRIFSRISDEESRFEIETGWRRLREELKNPLPIMAWPTGDYAHFTPRDIACARDAGLRAAFSTNSDYSHVDANANRADEHYSLCRFSLPHRIRDVLQYGSWVERGKQLVRGSFR